MDRTCSRGSTAPKLHWQQRELFPLQCAFYRTQISQLLPGVIKQNVSKFALFLVSIIALFQLSSLISPKRRKSGENNLNSLLTTSNTFKKMFGRFLSVLGIPLCRGWSRARCPPHTPAAVPPDPPGSNRFPWKHGFETLMK